MKEMQRNILVCNLQLMRWNRQSFGRIHTKIQQVRNHMKHLQISDPLYLKGKEHQEARNELQSWLERDEILGRHRLKALWLKSRDQNTKPCHNKASYRRKRNKIGSLRDGEECWRDGEE